MQIKFLHNIGLIVLLLSSNNYVNDAIHKTCMTKQTINKAVALTIIEIVFVS